MRNRRLRFPPSAGLCFALSMLLSNGCAATSERLTVVDLPRLSSPDLPPLPSHGDPTEFAAMCYQTRAAAVACKETLADYNRYATEIEKLGK